MAQFTAKMTETGKVLGNYVVVWRNDMKQAAKVEKIDDKAQRAIYTIVSGPDKDDRYSGRFDSSQEVEVYDEESVLLAVLES